MKITNVRQTTAKPKVKIQTLNSKSQKFGLWLTIKSLAGPPPQPSNLKLQRIIFKS